MLQLLIGSSVVCSSDALRSLSRLIRLQSLSLDLRADKPALSAITILTNLCSLHLQSNLEDDSLLHISDVTALFTLTRLTSLRLHDLTHGPIGQDDPPPTPIQAAAATLAFAPLANLTHLQHLTLHPSFAVDDSVFSALLHLTHLTHLSAARIQLAMPTHGHLPALRHLVANRCKSASQLMHTLQPLQPLPSLRPLLHPAPCSSSGFDIIISHSGCTEDAAAQAAALMAVVNILGSAPRLQLTHLTLKSSSNRAHLDGCAVAAGLASRGATLLSLSLHCLPRMREGWATISIILPVLQSLDVRACGLSDVSLGAMVSDWRSLRTLQVLVCGRVTETGWLRLAQTRWVPLRVYTENGSRYANKVGRLQILHFGVQAVEMM